MMEKKIQMAARADTRDLGQERTGPWAGAGDFPQYTLLIMDIPINIGTFPAAAGFLDRPISSRAPLWGEL
jgi:hypothetical protein